ncbi:hypothetical protein L9F63_018323, partial [Diploptera punctata]
SYVILLSVYRENGAIKIPIRVKPSLQYRRPIVTNVSCFHATEFLSKLPMGRRYCSAVEKELNYRKTKEIPNSLAGNKASCAELSRVVINTVIRTCLRIIFRLTEDDFT